ncbi:MAG: hypothetical protein HY702_02245 [Gemmatimonadetes bacterium]|nr:hypothetical protein [Gemmatimonadota bacterium]
MPTASAQEAAASLDYEPRILSLDAHDLEGILQTVLDVGAAAGVAQRAEGTVATLRRRIEAVRNAVEGRPRPRVLALEWLHPPFAPGHWVPEMVEVAGGTILFGKAAARSYELAWDEIEGAGPDVLVVMPCGFGLEESRADASRHAEQLRRAAGRAIDSGRAYVVDASSYFNRSGPRVVDGTEILTAILHPDAFPGVDLGGRAERWP